MKSSSGLLHAVPTAGRSRARQSRVLIRLLLAVSLGALTASSLEGRYGVQRWNVKTGKDAQAASIDLSSPMPTTIAFLTDLTRFSPPHPWPPPSRIAGIAMFDRIAHGSEHSSNGMEGHESRERRL